MMTKRIVSLLLAVMMIVAVIPAGIIAISADDTTYTDVELTPDSWLCETDPDSKKSRMPMVTVDGANFYYPDPRVPGDDRDAQIGSSDEGIITSVDDYIFADGFKFTFDANVCRAGCAAWGVTLFSISFGTTVNFKVSVKEGYKLTVNGTTYTKNPNVACTNSWEYTPTNETEANKINGTYTVEYMDGKLTVKLNGEAIDFGPDILIDAKNFAKGKINITKGWSWTKVAKDSYDPADYATDFLIFSNVTLSLPGDHIHNYEEYVSNNDATCTANGTKTAKCTVEGCEETNTVIIPDSALGHSFEENGNGTKTCSVCGKTIVAVEITPDSWIIADGSGNTSKPTVSTTDGTTFITKEFQSANEGKDCNEPAIITSRAKYDLSNGFVFSFDADLCRQNTNTWAGDGTNTTTISFGDAVTLEINGTGYSLIVDGTRHKLNINNGAFGWSPQYAPSSPEQVARLNANYKVEFKDGKVSLYVNKSLITFSDGLSEIEVTGDLSTATIRIFRGWGLCTDTKTYASLKDLDLVITAAPTPVAPTPVAPVYEGVQDAKVGDVLSVRFVGTVDSLNYSEVGFEITATDGANSWTRTQETHTVYSKLIGNTDTGVVEYTKENLHGQYIYALTIKGVPTEGTVTFNVTAYGIVDGKEVTDTTFAVTYKNGVFDKTVVIA